MQCPHCLVQGTFEFTTALVNQEENGYGWIVDHAYCPNEECGKIIITLSQGAILFEQGRPLLTDLISESMVYPKGISRSPIPKEVPENFTNDYKEACLVLNDSPKASAALSRRCLQHLLREVEKVTQSDLHKEIQEVIDRGKLPSEILGSLDAVRVIGNFAAHPIKAKQTGEVIDVEPGEAEWNLDVLESLFDYYFVQPAVLNKKREALNVKLKAAGKPPLK